MRSVISMPGVEWPSADRSATRERFQQGGLVGNISHEDGILRRESVIEPAEHIVLMVGLVAVGGGKPQSSGKETAGIRQRIDGQRIGDGPRAGEIRCSRRTHAWNVAGGDRGGFVF